MFQLVFLIIAGLVLVLYGIFSLSRVMQELISRRLRVYFGRATSKPVYGAAVGAFFTLLFKSSTAVELLTLSMVSAGLLSFFGSLGIILGANIGTSLSMQLIAFKITVIAPPIMLLGFLLFILSKQAMAKAIGRVIFYFGMLFFGFELIGQAANILKTNSTFVSLLTRFENPFLAILASAAVTAVLQSSSAVTGIIIMLGMSNLLSLDTAIPLILGANIGTTITGLLVAIGGSVSTKRTAVAHTLFNVVGVLAILPFLIPFTSLVEMTSTSLSHQIANAHLIFNLIVAAIFLIAIVPFAMLIMKIVPGKEHVISLWPKYIDERFLVQPAFALKAVKKEVTRAIALTNEMFNKASNMLFKFDKRKVLEVDHYEKVIDSLNFELHNYLGKLAMVTKKERLAPYLNLINDIERIGDRSVNLVEIAELKQRRKVKFSENTAKAVQALIEAITSSIKDIKGLKRHYTARLFERISERNACIIKALKRLKAKDEGGFASLIYSELLENLERIVEHCQSAAQNIKAMQ